MLNPIRDAAYRSIGANAGGAVDIVTCRAAGLTDERLHWLVETGRWQSPFPRVYIVFSGPVPDATLQHAALAYAGAGSVLSHESAGCFWRLCRQPPVVHVTVPYARQVDPQPGVTLHRSRSLSDVDVHPVFSPTRTRIERTVLDLLDRQPNADSALALVADSFRGKLSSPDALRSAIARHPKTRWRKIVLEALPDLRAGAQSPLELRDAALRRRHGLPSGQRQPSRLADGTEYLDVLIGEWQLHVELDGRLGHDTAQGVWRDMRRDNRSEELRMRELRYGWADMVDRPCQVAIQQAIVLRQQGWKGRFRRCSACPTPLPAEV